MSDARSDAAVPVTGIDAFHRGWVAVRLARAELRVAHGRRLAELIERIEPLDVIAVDMPIGLPATVRECDRLARAFVRPRHNSVFFAPPAAVYAESSFRMANTRARELLGRGVSRQAWALRKGVEEVACLAHEDARIIEVHPEVSFRALIGAPLQWSKTSWNGQAVRRRALASRGIDLGEMLGEAADVPPADVLDAAVAAWSARRHASGESKSLPASAPHGERQLIWY